MELQVHQQFQGMIYSILHILFLIIFTYLSIIIFYLLVISIAGHFRKKTSYSIHPAKKRIAVLITSYREDSVIINTVRQASTHNYPTAFYSVFLAADRLQENTIRELNQFNVKIFQLNKERSSKARSLNCLLNNIDEKEYDLALILDGDNIMLPGFMEKVNAAFQLGFRAVQGHRIAKNKNSSVAILDALSEEINNHLFRQSQRAVGFSSSLIGSGMAFEFGKLKEIYNKQGILDNPACDREVDFEMMKADIVVEYINDAYLLDEKVSKSKVYENQRRRWLESQASHLKLFFSPSERVPVKTKDYWNKLYINLMPPRLMILLLLLCMLVITSFEYFLHAQYTGISFVAGCILLLIYLLSLMISVPREYYNGQTLKAFLKLPLLLFTFLKSATGLRINRKEFVHTPKTFTDNRK